MNTTRALEIIERDNPTESPVDYLEACAYLIESGIAWKHQDLDFRICCQYYIEAGYISPEGEILISDESIWNLFS